MAVRRLARIRWSRARLRRFRATGGHGRCRTRSQPARTLSTTESCIPPSGPQRAAARIGASLLGKLPDDVGRVLVVAQTEKTWLPQPSVIGPFGESNLGYELGPRPVRSLG